MKKQLTVACLLVLACAPPSAALRSNAAPEPPAPRQQQAAPGGESLPPELRDAFKPVGVPDGKDAWALQIITRGGITGRGRGDVTVTSDGSVSCTTPCTFGQSAAALASLSQLIAAAKPSKWKSSVSGTCNDCYLTLLVLQRRSGNGAAKTYTLYWDDTAAVPADVKEIGRAVAKLAFVPAGML